MVLWEVLDIGHVALLPLVVELQEELNSLGCVFATLLWLSPCCECPGSSLPFPFRSCQVWWLLQLTPSSPFSVNLLCWFH